MEVLTLATVALLGWEECIHYPIVLLNSPYFDRPTKHPGNYSIIGNLDKIISNIGIPSLKWLLLILPCYTYNRTFRESKDHRLDLRTLLRIAQSFLFMGTIMSSIWPYHFVMLYPLLYILAAVCTNDFKCW